MTPDDATVEDETLRALLALADPIRWEWHAHPNGEKELQGHGDGTFYRISSPLSPDEVDTFWTYRMWRIAIRLKDDGYTYKPFAPSLDAAKELCVRYAITGYLSEIRANEADAKDRVAWYREADEKATADVQAAMERHRFPPLNWQVVENQGVPPMLNTTSERGQYGIRYLPGRRWVVRFRPSRCGRSPRGVQVTEKNFLTRKIAEAACALHSHTGHWEGSLKRSKYVAE